MANKDITTKEDELSFVHVCDDSSVMHDGKSMNPFNRFDTVSIATSSICSFVHVNNKNKYFVDDAVSFIDGDGYHQYEKKEENYDASQQPFVIESMTTSSLCWEIVLDNDNNDDTEKSVLSIEPLSIVSHNNFSYKEALLMSPSKFQQNSPEESKNEIDHPDQNKEITEVEKEPSTESKTKLLILITNKQPNGLKDSESKSNKNNQTLRTLSKGEAPTNENGKNQEIDENFDWKAQKNQRNGGPRRQRQGNKKRKKKKKKNTAN